MSTVTPRHTPVPIPPLKDGDVLSRDEFERRYDAMPELKKAELLDGVVYVASPVNLVEHGSPHTDMSWWLVSYKVATPGVITGDNSGVRLDVNDMTQPDLLMMIDPIRGSGQARIAPDGVAEGPPELAIEIAASSVGLDRGKKRFVYERAGVREYVVWRVRDRMIDWSILRDGQYEPLKPSADGTLRSEVFPGLWLNPDAMLTANLAGVIATLQRGLATPEHAAFAASLAGA